MMHIMSASLTGWGIGQFRITRRPLPMLGMYAAAMGLHGLWNASVVAITVGGIRSAASSGGPDIPGVILVGLGVTVLGVLCLAIPVSMWAINWQLRKGQASAAGGQNEAAAPTSNEGFPALDQSPMPVENDGAADAQRAPEEPPSPPSGPAA
jgi:protease prsW family protein